MGNAMQDITIEYNMYALIVHLSATAPDTILHAVAAIIDCKNHTIKLSESSIIAGVPANKLESVELERNDKL